MGPQDPAYKVLVMKIVIGDDAPDNSLIPASLRPAPDLVPGAAAAVKDKSIPGFELQRGSASGDPETEWLINGLPFDETRPLISVKQGSAGLWRTRNGGGGWVHPMHLHQEEHRVVARNGELAPDVRHADDTAKEDVIALDPSEEVVISRRFRTFAEHAVPRDQRPRGGLESRSARSRARARRRASPAWTRGARQPAEEPS